MHRVVDDAKLRHEARGDAKAGQGRHRYRVASDGALNDFLHSGAGELVVPSSLRRCLEDAQRFLRREHLARLGSDRADHTAHSGGGDGADGLLDGLRERVLHDGAAQAPPRLAQRETKLVAPEACDGGDVAATAVAPLVCVKELVVQPVGEGLGEPRPPCHRHAAHVACHADAEVAIAVT